MAKLLLAATKQRRVDGVNRQSITLATATAMAGSQLVFTKHTNEGNAGKDRAIANTYTSKTQVDCLVNHLKQT